MTFGDALRCVFLGGIVLIFGGVFLYPSAPTVGGWMVFIGCLGMVVAGIIINPSTVFGCPHCGRTFFNSGTVCRGCGADLSARR